MPSPATGSRRNSEVFGSSVSSGCQSPSVIAALMGRYFLLCGFLEPVEDLAPRQANRNTPTCMVKG